MEKKRKKPGRVIVLNDEEILEGTPVEITQEHSEEKETASTSEKVSGWGRLSDLTPTQRVVRDALYRHEPIDAYRYTAAISRERKKRREGKKGIEFDPKNPSKIGLRGKTYELGLLAQELVRILYLAYPDPVSLTDLKVGLNRDRRQALNIRQWFRKRVGKKETNIYSKVIKSCGKGLVSLKT